MFTVICVIVLNYSIFFSEVKLILYSEHINKWTGWLNDFNDHCPIYVWFQWSVSYWCLIDTNNNQQYFLYKFNLYFAGNFSPSYINLQFSLKKHQWATLG